MHIYRNDVIVSIALSWRRMRLFHDRFDSSGWKIYCTISILGRRNISTVTFIDTELKIVSFFSRGS